MAAKKDVSAVGYTQPFKDSNGYAQKVVYYPGYELSASYYNNPEIDNTSGVQYYFVNDNKFFIAANTASEDATFRAENTAKKRLDFGVEAAGSGKAFIKASGDIKVSAGGNDTTRLSVYSNGVVAVSSNFYATSNAYVNNNLYVSKNLYVSNSIYINNVKFDPSLFVTSNNVPITTNSTSAIIDNKLYVSDNISTGGTVTGTTINDSKGQLRRLIQNNRQSNTSYTLVANDAGKHILANGEVTIPASVFSAGDQFYIVYGPNATSASIASGAGVTLKYRDPAANTLSTITNLDLTNIGAVHVMCISTTAAPNYFMVR